MAYGRLETYNILNDYDNNGNYATLVLTQVGTGLDCKGARLIGNGTSAIAVDGATNKLNITNCMFTNFSHITGTIINPTSNSRFINNTIENSTIAYASVGGSNVTIANNTIVNATTSALTHTGTTVNWSITYNTVRNSQNGFNFLSSGGKNHTFTNNSFINLTGMGINFGAACTDCRIINNTFDNVSGYAPIRLAGASTILVNISLNIFRNINRSTNATVLINTVGQNNRIWANNYYGDAGIQDRRTNNNETYCVDGVGNFYSENITLTYRGNGTLGSDCGLVNLTNPESAEILINSTYLINWTKQDAARSVTYALYYTNDSGTRYYFLANATTLNYTLQINNSLREANGTYLIRIVPVVEGVNGTNDNSIAAFSIDPNNPSASITQSSTGSMELGTVRTVTCTASDTIGLSSISMSLDGKTCSTSTGDSCAISYTAATTGDKTVSCTATDRSTRTKLTSVSFSVTSGGAGGSTGGGGGGGGSGGVKVDVDLTSVNEKTITKSEGDSVSFTLDGSAKHEIQFTKVESTGVTLTIQSTPKSVDLKIGDTKNIDVDDNGVYDISVSLSKIVNGIADVVIKKISIPVPVETVDVTSTAGTTSLSANENANVIINGIQSSLTVTSVTASSATATIAGETITLNVGQSQNVDLNDDGTEDVKITLTGIVNGKAKFEIQKAEARVIAEAALEQAKKEAAIEAVKKPKFNLAYIIGLAGLVLILGIVMLIHHFRHGRHIKK